MPLTIPPHPHAGCRLGATAAFWLVASAFALGIGVSAVPTPLYAIYQRADGFGTGTTTIVFAAFSIAVAVTLATAGPISDRLGRRRVLIPALLLDAGSCAVFMAWPQLPGLIMARLLCGVAVGLIAATATAFLEELGARRDAAGPSSEKVATAANLGGVGLGCLAAGILAQYAPAPLRLSYAVYVSLLLVVAALLGRVGEGPGAGPRRSGYLLPRLQVPEGAARRYLVAALGALLALSSLGLFASLVPTFLSEVLHRASHALSGGVACIAFLSAACGQLLAARRGGRSLLGTGCLMAPAGLILMTLALWSDSLDLFLCSGVITGAGAGLVFKSCLAEVSVLASADARAGCLAGLYLSSYLGLAVSIIGLGRLASLVGDRLALLAFAASVAGGLAAVYLERRPATRPSGLSRPAEASARQSS